MSGAVISLSDSRVRVSLRTVTDSKGRFVFDGLPASDGYTLDASKLGYAGGSPIGRVLLSADGRLRLAEGEWFPDAKITLWRLGSISGTILDEKGEPVVDVPVRVLTRVRVAGIVQLAAGSTARTDDRGFYRLAGLLAGSYIITLPSVQSTVPPSTPPAAVAGLSPTTITLGQRPVPKLAGIDVDGSWLVISNYLTPVPSTGKQQAYPVLFYPNARSVLGADPVLLQHGEEKRNIDFLLKALPTARLSGRVIGPADVLSGLVIRLLPDGSETLGEGAEQATALVGPDGAFTLVGVPDGEYWLDARTSFSDVTIGGRGPALPSTPGMASDLTTIVSVPSVFGETMFRTKYTTGHEAYSARLQVSVRSADISNLEVVMQRGATISGRVALETGMPLPSMVSVRVEPASGDPALGGQPTDRAVGRNAAGRFAIQGLRRGPYFLRVFAGAGLIVKSIVSDADYTDRPFDATNGTDINDVVVTLTDRAAILSGRVHNGREGTAARAGAVILFPVDPTHWTRFGLEPPRIKAVTVGNGTYEFVRIPAGSYYVIAVDATMRHAWQDPLFFPIAAALATPVKLEWGATSVQDLTMQRVILK